MWTLNGNMMKKQIKWKIKSKIDQENLHMEQKKNLFYGRTKLYLIG
jgi:hypothetical protein